MASEDQIIQAALTLDEHVAEMIRWHFSEETGCTFWLNWAKEQDWNPLEDVSSFADLCEKFPYFQDEWLRDYPMKCGCPKPMQAAPSIYLRPGEPLVCPNKG